MFFCPNCNNAYDISRTIQTGGFNSNISTSETSSEIKSDSIIGGSKYNDLINNLLNNENVSIDDISVDDFIKSQEYKKLTPHDKEIIYNKLQTILPKNKKKIMLEKPKIDIESNLAFFVCNNCGFSENIEEDTLIFSRSSDSISQTYGGDDYKNIINSNILPITRKYICPNKNCESHKVPEKKEAKIFRKNNSYNVIYICITCGTSF